MTDCSIDVRDLCRRFDRVTAVDGVSFGVATGTVTGLLGPNGAGKSTLIHLLSTLLTPDSGTASVAGCDLTDDPAGVRASIALTGQYSAVDEVLTGRQNLLMFGRLQGLSRSGARSRADELLTELSLSDAADRRVRTYSGGMRRRLDLACSVVVPPPVLFLDEPTTGLDPRSRHELWVVVDGLRAAGTTVLLTTQYLEEADRLADSIVLIDRGRVVAEGTPDELKSGVGSTVCAIRVEDEHTRDRVLGVLGGFDPRVEDAEILLPEASAATIGAAVGRLTAAGIEPDGLVLRRPTLDEVFLALTGTGPERGPGGGPPDGAPAGDAGDGRTVTGARR